jgi:hypothetical protein
MAEQEEDMKRKRRCTRTAVSGQKPNYPTPELQSKNFNLPGRL